MSTTQETWTRLRAEAWCADPSIASKNDSTAKFQKLSDGSGSYVNDDYSVIIDSMPAGLTAEDYLMEFAKSPNAAVNRGLFNAMNRFKRRTATGTPKIGDIYDIDILGPDNGSIVLAQLSPGFGTATTAGSWFDIQTISCDETGSHPENGAREFGFEYVDGGVKFYTRGVSRPGNFIIRLAGAAPQMLGWTGMMKGISESIRARGGSPRESSFAVRKVSTA